MSYIQLLPNHITGNAIVSMKIASWKSFPDYTKFYYILLSHQKIYTRRLYCNLIFYVIGRKRATKTFRSSKVMTNINLRHNYWRKQIIDINVSCLVINESCRLFSFSSFLKTPSPSIVIGLDSVKFSNGNVPKGSILVQIHQ